MRKPFWHECKCSMQIPPLVPLQTQFTGSTQCFLPLRDMTMQFLCNALSLALWSNLGMYLRLSKIKGDFFFFFFCLLLAHIAYCYFWQLHSKMSSASINSYKSNIHYAAIANLFMFFFTFNLSLQSFCIACAAHTHTCTHT